MPNARKEIEFVVYGQQATQGSKVVSAVYNRDGKPVLTKDGRVVMRTHDSNKRLESWRQDVAAAAYSAMQKADAQCIDWGPVALGVVMVRHRPKLHFGTGRNAGKLKPLAPGWTTSRPDASKVVRAIEDAMATIVYRDDAQIALHCDASIYGPRDETHILVATLDEYRKPAHVYAWVEKRCKMIETGEMER